MSFWDSVKKIGISAKCLAGMHEGDFKPIQGKPECHLGKTCPNCNKYIETIAHKYHQSHYLSENSCKRKSSCKHCGEEKITEKHSYDYTTNEGCDVYNVCSRCRSKKFLKQDHHWVPSPVTRSGDPFEEFCYFCKARRLDNSRN